ncbi:hypothetical protein VP01_44g4 [Puccinia sorghi]|uniref:Uncharacterized protein n=1 Tax=Puccinia sorghi TaxID=27349 RepID=A0A0L6UP46_9BASI|nr:hypothetical protein VP01_44g4 [Puccinia sorghi]
MFFSSIYSKYFLYVNYLRHTNCYLVILCGTMRLKSAQFLFVDKAKEGFQSQLVSFFFSDLILKLITKKKYLKQSLEFYFLPHQKTDSRVTPDLEGVFLVIYAVQCSRWMHSFVPGDWRRAWGSSLRGTVSIVLIRLYQVRSSCDLVVLFTGEAASTKDSLPLNLKGDMNFVSGRWTEFHPRTRMGRNKFPLKGTLGNGRYMGDENHQRLLPSSLHSCFESSEAFTVCEAFRLSVDVCPLTIFFLSPRPSVFGSTLTHTHINLQPAVSNASEVDDTSQRTIFIKPPESDLTTYCDSLTHSREFPHKKQSRLVSLSSIELQGPERSPRLQSQHSSVL